MHGLDASKNMCSDGNMFFAALQARLVWYTATEESLAVATASLELAIYCGRCLQRAPHVYNMSFINTNVTVCPVAYLSGPMSLLCHRFRFLSRRRVDSCQRTGQQE
jgi:hypothetical protein